MKINKEKMQMFSKGFSQNYKISLRIKIVALLACIVIIAIGTDESRFEAALGIFDTASKVFGITLGVKYWAIVLLIVVFAMTSLINYKILMNYKKKIESVNASERENIKKAGGFEFWVKYDPVPIVFTIFAVIFFSELLAAFAFGNILGSIIAVQIFRRRYGS